MPVIAQVHETETKKVVKIDDAYPEFFQVSLSHVAEIALRLLAE